MTLRYGFVRARVISVTGPKTNHRPNEIQYHLHASLRVGGDAWDVAVNVGTNDADDLLQYRLVYDFHHALIQNLKAAAAGESDLTGTAALPALDFLRSDVLAETGQWRLSDVMDGSERTEPYASLRQMFERAQAAQADTYVFGRFYPEGDGIHDAHMNRGSTKGFLHRRGDDSNDHNDVWQDGGVIINFREAGWAAYFAAFQQQFVPTDDLGNPRPGSRPIR
jgi:Uncharacterized conserved protein (DUF2278)